MKLGVSQIPVQSDTWSTYIRLGHLSYLSNAASLRPPTGSTSSTRRFSPQGQVLALVEAPAENFLMARGGGGRWAHWAGQCGGGGVAAAVAAGRGWLRFVLRLVLFFDVVVDVPVVQVVDVGLYSSWTTLSCPLLCKTGVLVHTVQPVEFRSCSSWPRC